KKHIPLTGLMILLLVQERHRITRASNSWDIRVTFARWLLISYTLSVSIGRSFTSQFPEKLGWLLQTQTERNVQSTDHLTSIPSNLYSARARWSLESKK